MADTSDVPEPVELLPWRQRLAARTPGWLTGLFSRASLQRAALGMVAGTLLAVALPIGWLYPYLHDDRSLDLIVRIVALDWRDFGEGRARTRLQYELDHQRIGGWVKDEDCRFEKQESDRVVHCGWAVAVEVPGMDVVLPLSFTSEARIDGEGDLE